MFGQEAMSLARRQIITDGDGTDAGSWWYYSTTAYIIKWVIVAVLFALFLLFVVGGYIHLNRRLKRNQPPLRYHRWLMSRRQRQQHLPPPPSNHYGYYRHGNYPNGQYGQPQSYPMQPWGPAPPAYQEPDYVPPYAPPQGSSKVNPDQTYSAPPGPPPAAFGSSSAQRGAGTTVREFDYGAGSSSRETSRMYSPVSPVTHTAAK